MNLWLAFTQLGILLLEKSAPLSGAYGILEY